ncbi:hypothetical protein [Nocardiopsis oceani]
MTSLRPRALGADLSLTSTGVASSLGWCTRIRPDAPGSPDRTMKGLDRLRYIVAKVGSLLGEYDLVVIEGPSYGSRHGSAHERGGLWWMVRDAVEAARIPVAVASPSSVKLWAAGHGHASKQDVIDAMCDRYPNAVIRSNDEADALALASLGAAWLAEEPGATDAQRRALSGVDWPHAAMLAH